MKDVDKKKFLDEVIEHGYSIEYVYLVKGVKYSTIITWKDSTIRLIPFIEKSKVEVKEGGRNFIFEDSILVNGQEKSITFLIQSKEEEDLITYFTDCEDGYYTITTKPGEFVTTYEEIKTNIGNSITEKLTIKKETCTQMLKKIAGMAGF